MGSGGGDAGTGGNCMVTVMVTMLDGYILYSLPLEYVLEFLVGISVELFWRKYTHSSCIYII